MGKGTSSTQKSRLGWEMLVPRRVSKLPPELAQATSMSLASSSSFLAAWCSAFESKGWKFKTYAYVLPVLQNPASLTLFTHGGMFKLSISWRFHTFSQLSKSDSLTVWHEPRPREIWGDQVPKVEKDRLPSQDPSIFLGPKMWVKLWVVFPKGFFAKFANHITPGGKFFWSSCFTNGILKGEGGDSPKAPQNFPRNP